MIYHKLWISDLNAGTYVASTGEFEPHSVLVNDERVSRVNIIATVVDVFAGEHGGFASITLDDGSSTIQARAFKEQQTLLSSITLGDRVLVLAKPRVYQEELYLVVDAVQKVLDPHAELLRKVELIRRYGHPKIMVPQIQKPHVTAPQQESSPDAKVKAVEVIMQHSEFGISLEMLSEQIDKNLESTESLVLSLVKEGRIYQDKPGYYKII